VHQNCIGTASKLRHLVHSARINDAHWLAKSTDGCSMRGHKPVNQAILFYKTVNSASNY